MRLAPINSLLPACTLASAVLLLTACSEPSSSPGQSVSAPERFLYDTQIRWTSYGIPHVKADDWGSLGYGFAYATANAAVCTIARDVLMVNGNLSRYLGPDNGHFASDVFHRALLDDEMIDGYRAGQDAQAMAFSVGYVAGYNRYVREHRDRLPAACAGADWVREITETDVDKLAIGVGIRYGLGRFEREMANAAPPGNAVASIDTDFEQQSGIGSNAVAMGRDVTANGRGVLLGNPHYPWQGSSRFHMIHATIPGEVDVMGASLYTTNRVGIGFNEHIAWTHTVSTGLRATLYALTLNPDNPTQYLYADSYRDMERRTINVPVRNAEGSADMREHEVYLTHYGPVLVSNQLPWTETRAYAIRDVNLYNDRSAATYDALSMARNIDDVETALNHQGVAWVNTIAADSAGTAFYADISAVPNVDGALIERCSVEVEGAARSLVILDGSDPGCEWRHDDASAIPGAMPAEAMPRLRRNDYVHNANDSYWLSNPHQPLEAYSPIIGAERSQVSLRTRAGLVFIEEALASGEAMTPQHLQDMLFSHRHFGAELFLDQVLSVCQDQNGPVVLDDASVDIDEACTILSGWDRREDIDSRGAHVWREFWRQASRISNLYQQPFDVNDPVNTPRDLAINNTEVRSGLMRAMANAKLTLENAGLSLDATLGEVQFEPRNEERIPIPGGDGGAGMWSVITTQLRPGVGYSPILHGNSYMQAVGWDDNGRVHARAILSYSQSEDPASPHFADQTRLYAQSQWIDLPFYEEDILADPNLVTLVLQE